jgi:hypothetical protein
MTCVKLVAPVEVYGTLTRIRCFVAAYCRLAYSTSQRSNHVMQLGCCVTAFGLATENSKWSEMTTNVSFICRLKPLSHCEDVQGRSVIERRQRKSTGQIHFFPDGFSNLTPPKTLFTM